MQLSDADRAHYASICHEDNFLKEACQDGFVRGTRLSFPLIGPSCKYSALFDDRNEFDALRLQFLIQADSCSGIHHIICEIERLMLERSAGLSSGQTHTVQLFLESALHWRNCLTGMQEPSMFASRAWPAYIESIKDPSYYFSVAELTIIAAQAQRNVAIFKSVNNILQFEAGYFQGQGPLVLLKIIANNEGEVHSLSLIHI